MNYVYDMEDTMKFVGLIAFLKGSNILSSAKKLTVDGDNRHIFFSSIEKVTFTKPKGVQWYKISREETVRINKSLA